eukprot:CAMPEP_0174282426 /NCGR_PEP_ID=MMETSP0809-20121228/2919_1 /TAXON_ID=73025 ORGANISM="Eutreptiella gymnastica-like, Strain CCMP1594" /NCGR_SAMPLE_ID=MMETSP0809 /ASSEMBLY_ACC=CAM_ASM_000658 /LENGTH=52 /DNA_ID=CAMNT_0015376613 /DNA_START=166 /DNA_END=321 /DNA_ORIENTATION=-
MMLHMRRLGTNCEEEWGRVQANRTAKRQARASRARARAMDMHDPRDHVPSRP